MDASRAASNKQPSQQSKLPWVLQQPARMPDSQVIFKISHHLQLLDLLMNSLLLLLMLLSIKHCSATLFSLRGQEFKQWRVPKSCIPGGG